MPDEKPAVIVAIPATAKPGQQPPLEIQPVADEAPKHVFHGFTELPVGFHERARAAGLARAVIAEAAEVHDPATNPVRAELDIVPTDPVVREKLTPKKEVK